MPLTDVVIRNAKPGDKPIRLFDGQGLYLEIAPKGGKWWRLKYRYGHKEKRLSLGVYPEIGLKEARERRDANRKLLADGIDPCAHKQAVKAARAENHGNTFKVVALEWHTKNAQKWAPEHADRVISRLKNEVFPRVGTRPISELSAAEILSVVQRVESRGLVDTAHRILGHFSQIFRYAVATRRADRDPTPDLRGALSPVKVEHFAATTDLKRLGEILQAMDHYRGTFPVKCALKLAPLLFVRPGELRKAEWADFDLETGEWRYFVTKTKSHHIVPLSTQAKEILRDLQPLTGRGRFVFPCARSGERPMSDNTINAALRRMDIGKNEMTAHGFRAVARTIGDETLGFRVDFLEHQLAHAVKDPNGRAYNRTAHLAERRKMMQAWSDFLDKLKSGTTIVPFYQTAEAQ